MTISALEARLQHLEAIEAIRPLKSRYLFFCDRKDPEGVRDCFAPGEVTIDFGRIGVFTHRDQLVVRSLDSSIAGLFTMNELAFMLSVRYYYV